MSRETFTTAHVVLSLVGIASGFVVGASLLNALAPRQIEPPFVVTQGVLLLLFVLLATLAENGSGLHHSTAPDGSQLTDVCGGPGKGRCP